MALKTGKDTGTIDVNASNVRTWNNMNQDETDDPYDDVKYEGYLKAFRPFIEKAQVCDLTKRAQNRQKLQRFDKM